MSFLYWLAQTPQGDLPELTRKVGILGWLTFAWSWWNQNVNIQNTPIFAVVTGIWFTDMILGITLAILTKTFRGSKVFLGMIKWGTLVSLIMVAWGFRYYGGWGAAIIPPMIEMTAMFTVSISALQNAADLLDRLSPETEVNGQTKKKSLVRKFLQIFEERVDGTIDSWRSQQVEVKANKTKEVS